MKQLMKKKSKKMKPLSMSIQPIFQRLLKRRELTPVQQRSAKQSTALPKWFFLVCLGLLFNLSSTAVWAAPAPSVTIGHQCNGEPGYISFLYEHSEEASLEWTNPSGDVFYTMQEGSISPAEVGTYTLYVVTENKGQTIRQGPYTYQVLDLTPNFTYTLGGACNGTVGDGSIQVNLSIMQTGVSYQVKLDELGVSPPPPVIVNMTSASHTFSNLSANRYAVTITANGTCTSTEVIDVYDETLPINVSANVGTCNQIGGTIQVQLPIFQTGQTYDISVRNTANNHVINYQQSTSSYDLTNVAAGNYEVTASLGSCTGSQLVDVIQVAAQVTVAVNNSNGCRWHWQANLVGDAAMNYSWTLLDNNQDPLTTLPTSYTLSSDADQMWLDVDDPSIGFVAYVKLVITTADGCTYTQITPMPSNRLFPEYPSIKQPTLSPTNASCQASDGTLVVDWGHMQVNPMFTPTAVVYQLVDPITLQPGPEQLFTIPAGATQVTIPNLGPGTYNIGFNTASDCHRDEFTLSATIQSANLFTIDSRGQPYCLNGSAYQMEVLSPSVADGATYQWGVTNGAPIAGATGALYNAPSTGFYTVTVTYGGCTAVKDFSTSLFIFDPFYGTSAIDHLNCGSKGSIRLAATDASLEPYSFSLTAPSGTVLNSEYSFNAGGSETVVLTESGNYSMTITSASSGCTQVINPLVINNDPIDVVLNSTFPSTCNSNDGALSVNTTSTQPGNRTFNYLWSTGATTPSITGLTTGVNYSVTVTDASDPSCQGVESFTFNNSMQLILVNTEWEGPSCDPGNHGKLWVSGPNNPNAASPALPFSNYQWSGPNGFTSNAPVISNLPDGNLYNVTVTDANGCTYGGFNYVRSSWAQPELLVEPVVSCANNEIGFRLLNYNSWTACANIDVNIYHRDLITGTDQLIQVISLASASPNHQFTFSATDAFDPNVAYVYGFGNCCNQWVNVKKVFRYSDYLPTTSIANVTPASCQTLGSATLTATGNFPPYQFIWSDGGLTATRNDLAPGNYTVSIVGSEGCPITQTVAIPGSSGGPSIVDKTTCDGTLSLDAINIANGTAPYTVSWSLNGGSPQSGTTLSQAGQYSISITDANGCVGLEQVNLTTKVFSVTASTQAPSCNGTDGSISLQVTNTGSSIASYQWSGPSGQSFVGQQLQGLAAGNYGYTVTDQAACTQTGTVQLSAYTPISANFLAGCNPQITAISGGQAPYQVVFTAVHPNPLQATFQVNLAANATYPHILTSLDEGNYDVVVTDANGCVSTVQTVNTLNTTQARSWTIKMQWYRSTTIPPVQNNYSLADDIKNDLEQQVQDFLDDVDQLGKEADLCERQGQDDLSFEYSQSLQHYTLYYYNLRDELVRTVPPAGVDFISDNGGNTALTDLLTYRSDPSATVPSQLLPEHLQVTQYNYNALGQAVSSKTPDKGAAESFYNSEGLLRFARDAKQVADGTCSYTLYDDLHRVTESGEINYAGSFTLALLDNLQGLPGTRQEHIKTYYTTSHLVNGTAVSYYNNTALPQRHLRNRVSYTESHQNGLVVTSTYSYDIHGNVEWIRQYTDGLGENYIAYDYDILTNLVRQVRYNEFSEDRFFHKYEYDEQNRLTEVYTSTDGIIWDRDAQYEFYAHGPLARNELGEDRIQGLDYLYTIHGWIKAINHPDLNYDLGQDGQLVGNNSVVMPDAFGFALGYYQGDFGRTGVQSMIDYNHDTRNLYNGNISAWANGVNTTALINLIGFTSVVDETLTQRNFTYDELNRIKTSKLLTLQGPIGNLSLQPATSNAFATNYRYDGNGNLQQLQRRGSTTLLDDVNYSYGSGDLANRLLGIEDQAGDNGFGDLAEVQGYDYDAIGNLVRSTVGDPALPDEALDITWRVDGKVEQVAIERAGVNSQLIFIYDASGNRVGKVYDPNLAVANDEQTTYHVRDGDGNILGTYKKQYNGTTQEISLQERALYGSKRLGNLKESIIFNNVATLTRNTSSLTTIGLFDREVSNRLYELSDHLGNVTMLLSDQKVALSGTHHAQVESYQQYYPFGWTMPERNANVLASRFGFNGKENDREWGSSLIQDYGFRLYNPAIGKFLSVDPLAPEYPWNSTYAFAEGDIIRSIDLDGLEKFEITRITDIGQVTLILVDVGDLEIRYNGTAISPESSFFKKYQELAQTYDLVMRGDGLYKLGSHKDNLIYAFGDNREIEIDPETDRAIMLVAKIFDNRQDDVISAREDDGVIIDGYGTSLLIPETVYEDESYINEKFALGVKTEQNQTEKYKERGIGKRNYEMIISTLKKNKDFVFRVFGDDAVQQEVISKLAEAGVDVENRLRNDLPSRNPISLSQEDGDGAVIYGKIDTRKKEVVRNKEVKIP